jgi:cytochrome oxidase Cu insertion factor (SCO1/SenC/PrrC family)
MKDGTFRDVTAEVGLDKVFMPMGANFGDIDNDGFLDIYLGTENPSFGSLVPNVLLHNKDGKSFVDVTASSGTGELHKGHATAFADIDNDGDEDIVAEIGGAVLGDSHALRLFENPGTGNDWISLKLRHVALSQFNGKVVAINFIYTSCALPNFCFRNSNTFGVLQKQFKEQMGRDLVLLTVTFDPLRDQPDVLNRYARTWKADPDTWHFLTGSVPEIQRVSNMFGVDYFPDEGLMNHSLHTAIVDREGRLAANIEGNQFTADQLTDLVRTMLSRLDSSEGRNQTRMAHNEALGLSPAK